MSDPQISRRRLLLALTARAAVGGANQPQFSAEVVNLLASVRDEPTVRDR